MIASYSKTELNSFESTLVGKTVFVTGHTGFTGSWLSLWLSHIGCNVVGYALAPNTTPALYQCADVGSRVVSNIGDIRNYTALLDAMVDAKPDLVLHLAAQPLVLESYKEPRETFEVNVQGTINVLEAARHCSSVNGVLCVTTDKVYKNNEWAWAYRENDVLGGHDPYSGSKAAAELAIASYAASFPKTATGGLLIATARGGNIIGGGDWSNNRLIPDIVRSILSKEPLTLRYPEATRPWQHVLGLVHAYLIILAGFLGEKPEFYARPWNLGPAGDSDKSVKDVISLVKKSWTDFEVNLENNPIFESSQLALDSSLARSQLDWLCPWSLDETIVNTACWYRDYYSTPEKAVSITLNQIESWRAGIR